MKKLIALLLAVVMTLGMVACGSKETAPETKPGAQATEKPEQPAESEKEEAGEPVELNWYLGGAPQEDGEEVYAEINKILMEKYNVTVNFHYIDFANYGQQMQMLLTSGDPIDMMWTSNWANDFYGDVSKGAYQPIDMDMVKEYGPHIMQEIPEGAWLAGVANGTQYAIPNIQVLARWPGILLQKKYIEKYGAEFAEGNHELSDFTELFQQIADNEDGVYPIRLHKGAGVLSFYISKMGLEYFSETNPLGIRIDDKDLNVINLYDTPEMKDYLNLLRDWYNRGIIRPDAASVTDMNAEYASGNVAGIFCVNNPDMPAGQAATQGCSVDDLQVVLLSDPYLATSSVVATMTAINAKSEHAKECIQVLDEFFNSEDTRVQNLLSFGIEGKHYNKVEDDLIEMIPNSGYAENCGWAHGTLFNCYRTDKLQPAWHPVGPDINNSAIVSPLMGFNLDPAPVKNELAQIAAVMDEFAPTLQTGSADVDETLAQMNAKLEQAGLETLRTEIQRQIDEWKAAK